MKACPNCGLSKALSEFAIDRAKVDGRCSWCRKCQNAARRSRYQADLDHERQRSRDYYAGLDSDKRVAKIASQAGRSTAYYRANPDKMWAYTLKKAHGMFPEQWYAVYEEQDGRCYLCERSLPENRSRIAIDHDHDHCPEGQSCSACRRGLACANCNSGIGLLGDDVALIRLVAANLERAQEITSALIAVAPVQAVLDMPDAG